MNEFLQQFLVEARELVDQAVADILALEEDGADAARLDSAFRAFHTLKGAAGIIEFADMGRAVHAAEDMLSDLRRTGGALPRGLADDCLACLDQVLSWLHAIEAAGAIPADTGADADAIVARFATSATPPAEPARAPAAAIAAPIDWRDVIEAQRAMLAEGDADAESAAGRIAAAGRTARAVLRHAGRDEAATTVAGAEDRARERGDAQLLSDALARLLHGSAPSRPAPAQAAEPIIRSLRVDIGRIDALVRLCTEFQVASNALGHLAALSQSAMPAEALAPRLREQHAVLARLVAALQRSVIEVRVLPLRHVFQRFPRLVREMAQRTGKSVQLVTEGEETEADKMVVEALFEPILHALRNAVDHGIEPPGERARLGKPGPAAIALRAERQGESVVLTIADDGRGIDPARVREVARARGLAAPDALDAMADRELLQLVFAPGFSTASEVTDLSGRGVGMDAIQAAVARIGGSVALESRLGHGTSLRLVLPFSVLMTGVMTVAVGKQRYGIPLGSVVATLRLTRERIAMVGAARAFVERGQTIPLLDLARLLDPAAAQEERSDFPVIVVSAGGQLAGLAVDAVGERMDVMLTPMAGLLAATPGLAGTTLLGDGSVLIVLDLEELLQ